MAPPVTGPAPPARAAHKSERVSSPSSPPRLDDVAAFDRALLRVLLLRSSALALVRQILARPDDVSDPQQLLARCLTHRMRDQQMILAAVGGDLHHLACRLLKEMDRVEILGVHRSERRGWRECPHARFGLREALG